MCVCVCARVVVVVWAAASSTTELRDYLARPVRSESFSRSPSASLHRTLFLPSIRSVQRAAGVGLTAEPSAASGIVRSESRLRQVRRCLRGAPHAHPSSLPACLTVCEQVRVTRVVPSLSQPTATNIKSDYEALIAFDRKAATGTAARPQPPAEVEGGAEAVEAAEARSAAHESAVHLRFIAMDLRARVHILQWSLQQMQPGLVCRLVRAAGARLDMSGDGPRSDGCTVGDIVVLLRATDVLLSRMASECGFRAQLFNDAAHEGRFAQSTDPQDAHMMESATRVRAVRPLLFVHARASKTAFFSCSAVCAGCVAVASSFFLATRLENRSQA